MMSWVSVNAALARGHVRDNTVEMDMPPVRETEYIRQIAVEQIAQRCQHALFLQPRAQAARFTNGGQYRGA